MRGPDDPGVTGARTDHGPDPWRSPLAASTRTARTADSQETVSRKTSSAERRSRARQESIVAAVADEVVAHAFRAAFLVDVPPVPCRRETSSPGPPSSRSRPSPPHSRSVPGRPISVSLPPRAAITSGPLVPRRTSACAVPTMVRRAPTARRRSRGPRRRPNRPRPPGPSPRAMEATTVIPRRPTSMVNSHPEPTCLASRGQMPPERPRFGADLVSARSTRPR